MAELRLKPKAPPPGHPKLDCAWESPEGNPEGLGWVCMSAVLKGSQERLALKAHSETLGLTSSHINR